MQPQDTERSLDMQILKHAKMSILQRGWEKNNNKCRKQTARDMQCPSLLLPYSDFRGLEQTGQLNKPPSGLKVWLLSQEGEQKHSRSSAHPLLDRPDVN